MSIKVIVQLTFVYPYVVIVMLIHDGSDTDGYRRIYLLLSPMMLANSHARPQKWNDYVRAKLQSQFVHESARQSFSFPQIPRLQFDRHFEIIKQHYDHQVSSNELLVCRRASSRCHQCQCCKKRVVVISIRDIHLNTLPAAATDKPVFRIADWYSLLDIATMSPLCSEPGSFDATITPVYRNLEEFPIELKWANSFSCKALVALLTPALTLLLCCVLAKRVASEVEKIDVTRVSLANTTRVK